MVRLLPFLLWWAAQAQVSVLTYHNDLARTGQNLNETALTPAAVAGGSFHKLFNHAVDGYVYAQPLYVPGVVVPVKGAHNVVYVATEHDSVYAFDADAADSTPLWQTSFLNPASRVIAVPAANTNCGQIVPEIGVTGTPVIDPASGTLYAVAMTLENGAYHGRLHALDIATGSERAGSPVDIQAPGFVPKNYKQRPGLLLLNGIVYTSWSSHCDIGQYHGFIIAYDAKTLRLGAVYDDTPNGDEGSFWASGAAPAADSNGNIFVVSANGTFDANQGGLDLGESYIKLSTSNGLAVSDWFTPFNFAELNGNDVDTGSSGVVLLPDSAGSAAHPHLLVSAGKEGRIYLIDRDNMGHFHAGSDIQIPQSLPGAVGALFGMPVYFNGTVYFSGSGDFLKAFSIANNRLSDAPTSRSAKNVGGSVPSVSANGNQNGIVWLINQDGGGALHAYDAADVSRELYDGSANANDRLGSFVKFSTPTIANGKVYAGTQNSIAVFSLPPGTGSVTAVNAASYDATVAPGSLVSLFGNFGLNATPATGATLPWSLSSISVRISGMLAPLLYAGPNQINAQVPFEAATGATAVVVDIGGIEAASGTVTIAAAAPGLFTISGRAAVVNQDGTINSPDHAAPAGSIVSAYLTGLGSVNPPVPTGQPAPLAPLSKSASPVTAAVGGANADVLFAGLAPTTAGLFQVNLRIPQVAAGEAQLSISIAGASSNAAPIFIASQ